MGDADVVDVDAVDTEEEAVPAPILGYEAPDEPTGLVPPTDVRNRLSHTRGMLGKQILAYIGDTVWEFLVLRHQYMQVVRSPFTESQAVRSLKQAKMCAMLYHGSVLTQEEMDVMTWAMGNTWRSAVKFNAAAVEQVGLEQYNAAIGLRILLGWLYIDAKASDDRLERLANEMGLTVPQGEEDRLLEEITGGVFDPSLRPRPATFFLALAPLGHVALRLYVSRYFCQRPLRSQEFIYRVKMALRSKELDLASVGFMRDDATDEELRLMQGARDQTDTYSFAFECLLGHLALNKPYRLHQIVSEFGWAVPLPTE
jgi:23S rRNA maturation mini-RNase III